MSEIQENLNTRCCRVCGSTTNSFQPNRRKCTKCISKAMYDKRKPYFKTYYEKNKETFLEKSRITYLKNKNYIELLEDFTPYENNV